MCCQLPFELKIESEEDFDRLFPDEASCERVLFHQKWKHGWFCPHCGNRKMSANKRKQYQCSKCRYPPSARVGTMFEHGKLPLLKMFKMIYYLCLHPQRLSAMEISRRLEIGYEATLRNINKIRDAMADPLIAVPLVGPTTTEEMSLAGVVNPEPFRKLAGEDNPIVELFGEMSVETIPTVDAKPSELYGPELVSALVNEPLAGPEVEPEPEPEERTELERLVMVVAGTEDCIELLAQAGQLEVEAGGPLHYTEHDEALWSTGLKLRWWFRVVFRNAVGRHLPKYLVAYACRYNYRHRREQLFGLVLEAMVDNAPFTYDEQVHGEKSPLARRRAQTMATSGI